MAMISSEMLSLLFLCVLGLISLYKIWTVINYRRNYKLPPAVPGVPIFGNLFQIPLTQQGPWAKRLAEKYGEMFTCQFGSKTTVFLNSSRVVSALLERRAAIYSSRPDFPMSQGLISGDARMLLMPYGERWRFIRKTMHHILSTRQQSTFRPFQDLESKALLHDYLHRPDLWYKANTRYANSVIMSVVFGIRSDLENPRIAELFRTIEEFLGSQQPGANLVDAFPVLTKLPKALQWWRPEGERIFTRTRGIYKRELDELKDRMRKGHQRDCFAVDWLEASKNTDLDETSMLFVLGTLMEAGSDTSRASIAQIIAGAATYPDWVIRAREQLDNVCGHNAEKLPGWDDRNTLSYITAVVKEGFRWRPNLSEIGTPRTLIQDDEFEGYKFPAGTTFTWNGWAIALNPEEYEDPERFWPERFLNDELSNPMKGHWGFGTGRRVCAGWNVGNENVWIAIARLLYCFDFKEDPKNAIDTMRIPHLTRGQAPFPVKISVRSQAHADLIERDCAGAVKIEY